MRQILILSLNLLLYAYGQSPLPPNVVLITVDTLRPDHLGCYGYSAARTSAIDGLAAEGIRFRTVVAQVPLTLPSHCTILTGTYPMLHGVRDNAGYRLPSSFTTLAEIFRSRHYRTAAFVGSYVLHSKFGLNQGFEFYDDQIQGIASPGGIRNLNQLERRAGEVMQRAAGWIENARPPFFVWVHLYDPHDPYDPPAPFNRDYAGHPYDGEIAYADSEIARLIAALRRRNLYADTVMVLTSDHGESFGEHGEFTHGYYIYDSTLLVPLIIKPAEMMKARVIDQQVRTVDIAPTILQMLALPKHEQMQGTGLLGLMLGQSTAPAQEAYSETYYPAQFGWSSLKSLRSRDLKYIEAPRPEFFDLKIDPRESSNRLEQNSARAGQMKERLKSLERSLAPRGGAIERSRFASPETLEKLAALGYIGAPSRGNSSAGVRALPDPKDKLDVFRVISEAGQMAASGRCDSAIPRFLKILSNDPDITAVRFLKGRCHYNLKQFEAAQDDFKKVLAADPGNLQARFYLAASDFNLRRLQEAERGFQRILAIDRDYVFAHKYLGFIYQERGWTERAMEEFRKTVELDPGDAEAHAKLGYLASQQGNFTQAIGHFRKVIELDGRDAAAHYNLGLAYLKTAQSQLAQEELSQACRLDGRYCRQ
ncbi:MAG TPA: sulfatase-like hydrolase/transferase [Acidobacteriota bacterium]|jgi:arylsulfatase A-like enzyme/Tfp pilus assembly protein PilF